MDISLSFPDIMTKLYVIWEQSEKEKNNLQEELNKYKTNVDELKKVHVELLKNVETLQYINSEYEKEVTQLKKKLEDAEDDQKQFRKVSHILTMDRENSNYKHQIAILERRVAFYQNQCSNMKSSNDVIKLEQQTDTNDLSHTVSDINTYNDDNNNNTNKPDIITYNDDSIIVKEKKIKGVVYYLSDNNDIYTKNIDNSIGELKGRLESLPSGKTKVKWFK